MTDFDRVIPRRGTGALKWDGAAARFGEEVLPMWVADMDFAAPEAVQAVLAERVAHPIYGYPWGGTAALAAGANWMERRHGWRPDPAHMLLVSGVVPGLFAAVRAFTETGDGIIVMPPIYPPFLSAVREQGRELLMAPLQRDRNGRYEMDWERLEALLPRARMLLLCSPHNPSGRVWGRAELQHLGELARRQGVLVVSDEIHADLAYAEYPHIPFPSLFPDSLLLSSAGKSFNIAGIGGAFAVLADDRQRHRYAAELRRSQIHEINLFAPIAMAAAWERGGAWQEGLRTYLAANAHHLGQRLAAELPALGYRVPEFGYLAWLDLRALGLDDGAIAQRLRHAGLGLNPGPDFGPAGAGFVRLNFGAPRIVLDEGIDRLCRACG
ncbi:MAG: PatB family C-S lyase [Gammaproteobacteria bacterium]|nr:PatB family C-S lyase [Gammaproteobacteria bacterium]